MTKGDFSLSLTGGFILMLVATAVGALLITNLGGSKPDTESTIQQVVQNANTPICQNYRQGQEITLQDFKTIIYARHLGKCEQPENVVNLGFRLSNTSLDRAAKELSITYGNGQSSIIYSNSCRRLRSFNGLLVNGTSDGYVVFEKEDKIKIDTLGSTTRICACIPSGRCQ